MSRRVGVVWALAVLGYTVAVLQRTSLGVAGLDAAQRFGVSAGVLSAFAVVQIIVYGSMQVPAGVLVDRVRPRTLVVCAALAMAAGQVALALTHSFWGAIAARALVGAGDAITFITVIRLVAVWFPAKRVPLFTQLTVLTGQLGQVLSAIPLVLLLNSAGWTPTFLSAAGLSVFVAAMFFATTGHVRISDGPLPHLPRGHLLRDVRDSWHEAGTRLGIWTHIAISFSGTMFALLWGYPFLVKAQGVSPGEAGLLFFLSVVSAVVASPVMGVVVGHHPQYRSRISLGVVAFIAAAWTAVLCHPGPSPTWLLVLLMVALSLCGPGSLIGFDYARTFNPPSRMGAATGMVNMGGLFASLLCIAAIGIVLELVDSANPYTLHGFRIAMSVQYVVWVVGVVGIYRSRATLRRRASVEPPLPAQPAQAALPAQPLTAPEVRPPSSER